MIAEPAIADVSLSHQKTEVEVDDVLNKTIALFRFLIEKDHFEKYYNSHLAKRLISSRSVSDDAERNMLAKFKVEAGAAFTKSAEGMMKDIKTSEDALAEYKRYQDRTGVVVSWLSFPPAWVSADLRSLRL